MARPLVTATADALEARVIPLAAILYLDIQNDPLYCWNGIGDLTFAAGQTGDANLDGLTFLGTASLIQIGSISDGAGGSDAIEISLPGVDLNQPGLKSLITTKRLWQFRRAIVWLMVLDPVTNAIVGKPFRIKTGRMDKMPLSESRGIGTIKVRIEGQQSYGNQPLSTRYSEQRDINPSDISQKWVHSLANMTATLGKPTGANTAAQAVASYGGGGMRDVGPMVRSL